MRGSGGSVWDVILTITIRTHKVLDGGLSRVYISQKGNFCPASREFGYKWVSMQPAFFINTTNYKNGDFCKVT
ncbi:hypothetical protein ACLX1H_009016 [Fusarium chlamydosporum]